MLARLPDGTRIVIREIRPDDKPLLVEGLDRLSLASNRGRFLSPKRHFTAAELRYLTEVDGIRHAARVVVLADDPTHLVAVGRYVRLAGDPNSAEIAIVVADDFQGQGLGSRLGLLLADHARAHGIERFTASMLSDNVAAHRLFAKVAGRLDGKRSGAIDELTAELAA
jgi:RimJ/RimL family protein N-acetyltransferase